MSRYYTENGKFSIMTSTLNSTLTLTLSMQQLETDIKAAIRDVPDFPKPGILFKDVTPVFKDPELCTRILDAFSTHYENMGIDAIVGIESRGFLFGLALATKMRKPFVLIRKAGK